MHGFVPQTFGPAPPQVWPAGQVPQLIIAPSGLGIVPQFAPTAAQRSDALAPLSRPPMAWPPPGPRPPRSPPVALLSVSAVPPLSAMVWKDGGLVRPPQLTTHSQAGTSHDAIDARRNAKSWLVRERGVLVDRSMLAFLVMAYRVTLSESTRCDGRT